MLESPLRLCYVLSYFHPFASGAERQALAQGTELVKRGHQVHVVTHQVPGYPPEELVHGIQVHRWVRSVSAGPLFGLSFVVGVFRALRRLRGRFDLVHTHQALWEAVATGLVRPALGGVPTLVQPASSGYYGEAEELARTHGSHLLRRLILRNSAFAAISADIERQWLAMGVPRDRMVRLSSGVDADHFHPGASTVENRLPARPRVIFTGRLHPQKNLERLIDAWPTVAQRTAAHLILVGGGDWRESLRRHAEALGVADHVHFMGTLADPAEYLRAADAFVLPSVAEGMSNSLLEAMATALPCLASSIGGNTDLIQHGENGLLVPPDDSGAWSAALIQVLENPSLAHRMGTAAREQIDAKFALPIVVDHYVELYRRLLANDPLC
jgi:L-malate glycosyltransferase